MKERQKFWSVLALLAAVFVVLFTVQATKTQARGNVLIPSSGPMPADAKATFDAQCAKCHGKDGRAHTTRGRLSHARNMTNAAWQNEVSDERLFNSINKGKGKGMPAYGKKLSEDQIDALVRYVRQLKR
jgi:mono/diheme cytochrome c family protein